MSATGPCKHVILLLDTFQSEPAKGKTHKGELLFNQVILGSIRVLESNIRGSEVH